MNTPTPQEISRFWKKVEVKGIGECWPWRGGYSADGYGSFLCGGSVTTASRASLAIKLNKGLEPRMFALHVCDNPKCVNPNHLFEGTNKDNMQDCARKGRAKNGNSGKTHCKRGHEFNAANTRLDKDGGRYCRTCHREESRARRLKVTFAKSVQFPVLITHPQP